MTAGEMQEQCFCLVEAIVTTHLSVPCKKLRISFLSKLLEEAVPEVLGYPYRKITELCRDFSSHL